ncbi:hypothetical protein E1A91_D07G062800v1 [Gossypium mustelinum]|uniref:N-acetyltransferase domain-containing protein n=1 Tax=Gossypium mustelinum TaxID=34275 RepID=A0A5D2U6S5_GOSMU|nr:hypothetical protein E1A91_D07G062800v1 [Gossypium mustelinum]
MFERVKLEFRIFTTKLNLKKLSLFDVIIQQMKAGKHFCLMKIHASLSVLKHDTMIQDILVGLLRLRKCGQNTTCPELMGKCSIVRELHVYGTAVPVHGRDADKLQHQGYGTLLMEEAERIAGKEHRSTKIAVISGVGTRHYYRKLGYELDGPYMVKYLTS